MLLQLSLFVITVIQLTPSQSTYDVTQQDNDVNSCVRTEQVLSQLMMAVSQLQKDVKTVIGNVLQLQSGMSQLQKHVNAVNGTKDTNATTKGTLRNRNRQSHKQPELSSC